MFERDVIRSGLHGSLKTYTSHPSDLVSFRCNTNEIMCCCHSHPGCCSKYLLLLPQRRLVSVKSGRTNGRMDSPPLAPHLRLEFPLREVAPQPEISTQERQQDTSPCASVAGGGTHQNHVLFHYFSVDVSALHVAWWDGEVQVFLLMDYNITGTCYITLNIVKSHFF